MTLAIIIGLILLAIGAVLTAMNGADATTLILIAVLGMIGVVALIWAIRRKSRA